MADKHTSFIELGAKIRGDPGSVGLSATWQVRSPGHWMFPREQRRTATEDLLRFDYARNRSRQKEEVSRLNAAMTEGGSIRYFSRHIPSPRRPAGATETYPPHSSLDYSTVR